MHMRCACPKVTFLHVGRMFFVLLLGCSLFSFAEVRLDSAAIGSIGAFYRDQVNSEDAATDHKKFRSELDNLREDFGVGENIPPRTVHMENAKLDRRSDIVQLGRARPDHMHSVLIHCKSRNMDKVKMTLQEVSDPRNSKYGQHLTRVEIRDLTSNPESVNHVLNYLNSQSIEVTKRSEGLQVFITAVAPVSTWEEVLQTQFYEFGAAAAAADTTNKDTEKDTTNNDARFIRAHSYSIPEYLVGHINAIFNTVQFPDISYLISRRELLKNGRSHIAALQDGDAAVNPLGIIRDGFVTPQLLNNYYNIDSNAGNDKVSQGIYETLGQTYSPTDLSYFQNYFELPVEPVARDINGHQDPNACDAVWGEDCIEANLDIEYIMGVAWHVPTTYYYWDFQDFLLEWAQELSEMEDPPLVVSISYGADELDLPDSYRTTFEDVAVLLGTLGITLVASSGDDGASSYKARASPIHCGYSPSFPASSPYVVAVGATQGPETNNGTEVACSSATGGIITSGGGFSSLYPMPDWQKSFIDNYTTSIEGTTAAPYSGYAAGGRGFPDVSLMGYSYMITADLKLVSVSGTSASAPVFAAMLSLINAARADAGKSSLGWVNPSLYYEPERWAKDITQGSTHCAALYTTCCAQGYTAVNGWDPATGLGSVDFVQLKAALLEYGNYPNSPTQSPTPAAGDPTSAPVTAPSHAPTPVPSQPPTLDPGWFILSNHEGRDCTGDITDGVGVPTGRCMIEYNKFGATAGSTMYVCEAGVAYSNFYSDLSCSDFFLFRRDLYGLGCAYLVEDYYNSARQYSTDMQCVTAAGSSSGRSDVPPLPAYDGTYITTKAYDTFDGCTDELLSEYGYYRNGYCFNVLNTRSPSSYKYNYPQYFAYTDIDCPDDDDTGLAFQITLSGYCSLNYYYFDISPNSVLHSSRQQQALADRLQEEAEYIMRQQAIGDADTDTSADTDIDSAIHTTIADRSSGSVSGYLPDSAAGVSPDFTYYYFDQFFGSTDLFLIWQNGDVDPAVVPSKTPTIAPTRRPTAVPSLPIPTRLPTAAPSYPITLPPTKPPTAKPSTFKPTDKSQLPRNLKLKMDVSQVLQGVDAAAFNAAGDASVQAFTHAVSLATSGRVDASEVTIISVTDVTTAAASRSSSSSSSDWISDIFLKFAGAGMLEDSSVNIDYELLFNTFDAGFQDATTAYNAISASIEAAVSTAAGNQFDVFIHDYADVYGATALLSATSNTVDVDPQFSTTPVDNDPSDGDNYYYYSGDADDLSTEGADVTAIIVTVVLLIVLIAGVTLCCIYKEKIFKNNYGTLGSDSGHQLHVAAGSNGEPPQSRAAEHTNTASGGGGSSGGRIVKEGLILPAVSPASKRRGQLVQIGSYEEEVELGQQYSVGDNQQRRNHNRPYAVMGRDRTDGAGARAGAMQLRTEGDDDTVEVQLSGFTGNPLMDDESVSVANSSAFNYGDGSSVSGSSVSGSVNTASSYSVYLTSQAADSRGLI